MMRLFYSLGSCSLASHIALEEAGACYEAPVYIAWSRRNRSALIRVPVYHPGKEKATRAELRCPDPACNPYLTFAAMLHAGLEGIEKGYELPEPMETNLYDLSADERARLGVVPKIVLTAFAGASIVQLMKGEISGHWLELVVVAAIWIGVGWMARLWLRRRQAGDEG